MAPKLHSLFQMFAAQMVIRLLGFLTWAETYQSTSVTHKNPGKSLHFSTVVVIFAIYVDNDAGLRKLYLPNGTSN